MQRKRGQGLNARGKTRGACGSSEVATRPACASRSRGQGWSGVAWPCPTVDSPTGPSGRGRRSFRVVTRHAVVRRGVRQAGSSGDMIEAPQPAARPAPASTELASGPKGTCLRCAPLCDSACCKTAGGLPPCSARRHMRPTLPLSVPIARLTACFMPGCCLTEGCLPIGSAAKASAERNISGARTSLGCS